MPIKKANLAIILPIVILLVFASTCCACSTFMLKKGDAFIVGHNDDEFIDNWPGHFFVNKRGMIKSSVSINNLLGRPDTAPKIQWTSRYGSVTWNALGREFPMGGINEAGLHIDVMYLHDTRYPETNTQPHMFVYQWVQYQLDNYQSVTEVVQNLSQLVLETEKWHFFISDKLGQCACIEFIDGKPRVYTGESMPIPVLCNAPYELELLCLKDFQGFGGTRNIFVQTDGNDNRFVQAATMIKDYDPGQSNTAVQYGLKLLKQLERGSNKWSIVVDVNHSTIYFHTSRCRELKYFNYGAFDFSADTPVMMFDINAEAQGDVTRNFLSYEIELNRQLVNGFNSIVAEKTSSSWEAEVIERVARYPETTRHNKSKEIRPPRIIRHAGTVVKASNQKEVLVGVNEDGFDKDVKIWFLPAEKGKYGRVFLGFQMAEPVGGMNEQGLFFDRVEFLQGSLAPELSGQATFNGKIYEKIMEECSTVEQAVKMLQILHSTHLEDYPVMFVDKSGDSVIAAWDTQANSIMIIRSKTNYQILGTGEGVLDQELEKDDQDITITRLKSMLETACGVTPTVYSGIYDLRKGDLYLSYVGIAQEPIKLNLTTELKKGKHLYNLYSLFPQSDYTAVQSLLGQYYSPTIMAILAILVILFLSPFIIWPLTYVTKRRVKQKQHVTEDKKSVRLGLVARILAALNSVFCLVLLYYAVKYRFYLISYGMSIFGSIVGFMPLVIGLLALAEIIIIIILWKSKIWSLMERLYYLSLIFAAIFSNVILANLNVASGW